MSFKVSFAKAALKFRIERALSNRQMLDELSEFMRQRIYQNTKRGYYGGIKKNLAKFKPLSPGYVRQRQAALRGEKKKAKTGLFGKRSTKRATAIAKKKFGPFFSPARSNLTYTGEMLEALDASYSTRSRTVTAYVRDTGRSDDSGLSNQQVAVKVSADRPFPTIDVKGINTMIRKITASVRRSLSGSRR